MAWIESHQSLARHPKLSRLAAILKISRQTAVGHLHFIWWWALDYAPDGNLSKMGAAEVADAAGWTADPDWFLTALKDSGFVDDDGHIHDWHDYAGRLIASREAMREGGRRGGIQSGKARSRHPSTPPSKAPFNPPLKPIEAPYQPTVPTNQPTCNGSGEEASAETHEAAFDQFWRAYPKKKHRDEALRVFVQAGAAKDIETILADITWRKESRHNDEWQREAGKYIPCPENYLSDRPWVT